MEQILFKRNTLFYPRGVVFRVPNTRPEERRRNYDEFSSRKPITILSLKVISVKEESSTTAQPLHVSVSERIRAHKSVDVPFVVEFVHSTLSSIPSRFRVFLFLRGRVTRTGAGGFQSPRDPST